MLLPGRLFQTYLRESQLSVPINLTSLKISGLSVLIKKKKKKVGGGKLIKAFSPCETSCITMSKKLSILGGKANAQPKTGTSTR